jgi:hypothetical protein|tara:strand:- start:40348 stop:41940 length:1593 start_codon:yes stop_codon:yes gene_type:complete
MGIKFKQIDNLQSTFDALSGDFQNQITINTEDISGVYNDSQVLSGWKYFDNNVDISGQQGLLVGTDNIYTPNNLIAGGAKIGFPISTPRNSTPAPLGALQVTGGQIYFEDQLNIRNNAGINIENGSITGNQANFTSITGLTLNYATGQFDNILTISGVPVSTGAGIAYQADSGVALIGDTFIASGAANFTTLTVNGNTVSTGAFAAYLGDSGVALIGDTFITNGTGNFSTIDFGPIIAPAYQEGRLFYDSDNFTLSLYNDEADISLQVGQEEYLRVRNNTTGTISNGSAVLINGSQGTHPTIDLASADSEEHAQVVGLATHDISSSSFGYVTTYGIVRGLNTTGYSAGDEIFLSTGSGALTSGTIDSPNYRVRIGHVLRSHVNQGAILVQPGQAKLGGGDVKSLSTINVSGINFYDSAADSAGILGSSSNFVYNNASGFVGIGTSEPEGILDINSTISAPIVPRMTTAQMNLISFPVEGMVIYNTSSGKFAGYEASGWAALSSSSTYYNDDDYFYVETSTGTKRIALSLF